MRPRGPTTEKEIWKITRRTINIIQNQLTSNVCLFGSAGATLWADTGRVPNVRARCLHSHTYLLPTQDIDIVVSLIHGDAESIKRVIVNADGRYFLEPSKKRNATHKVLFCRLPGWRAYGRRVKVDILVSGTMGLPYVDSSYTPIIIHIPVMPLFDLLVMKTQGWDDHRKSNRKDYRAKLDTDVTDVDALLDRAMDEGVSYDAESAAFRHTSEFLRRALTLARKFAHHHGRWEKWRTIDFPL